MSEPTTTTTEATVTEATVTDENLTDIRPPVPPSLAELLNVPETFVYEGREFRMKELTLEQRGRFGKWLKDRALAAASNQNAPPAVQMRLFDRYLDGCASGRYEFDSAAGVEVMQTPDGQAMALYLCLSSEHSDIDFETARKMVDAKWSEIGVLVAEKLADPKSSAAVLGVLGLIPESQTSSPPSAKSQSASRRKKQAKSRRRK